MNKMTVGMVERRIYRNRKMKVHYSVGVDRNENGENVYKMDSEELLKAFERYRIGCIFLIRTK